MSEISGNHFCEVCGKETSHIWSGSGRKGSCMLCGNKLPPDVRVDLSKVTSHSL